MKIKNSKGFVSQFCSDIDYENLILEVYHDGQFFALLSSEGVDGTVSIQFPNNIEGEISISETVGLESFIKMLRSFEVSLQNRR